MIELSAALNIFGLLLDVAGVVLIFLYALPVTMDVKDRAAKITYSEGEPTVVMAIEYRRLARIGLGLLITGFGFQALGSSTVFWN